MLIILLIVIFLVITFFLYCIVHCTTSYDIEVNMDEQLRFIAEYGKRGE